LDMKLASYSKSRMVSRLNKNNQNLEINKNLIFLRKHKLINKKWTMCYPLWWL